MLKVPKGWYLLPCCRKSFIISLDLRWSAVRMLEAIIIM